MTADGAKPLTAYPQLANAGQALAAGRYEQAAMIVIGHLRAHPDERQGVALLGAIAMRLGALGQAEQFLRRAISLGLNASDVHRNLASAISQQGRLEEALEIYDRLAADNDDPTLAATRAIILDKLGRNAEASQLLKSLVDRCPGEPAYWISYGHNLRAGGETAEAVAAYRRAIEVDFERGEAWWSLANIKSKVLTDEDMSAMEQALDVAVDVANLAPIHFALGRGRHDRKQYEPAFHHYSEGNRLQAEGANYRAEELTDEVDESIRLFDHRSFANSLEGYDDQAIPVFIVSLPRSGSTLLEQMLGNHPAIETLGELPYIQALLRSVMEAHTRKARVTVPQLVQRLTAEEKSALGSEYLRRAALHRGKNTRLFMDKLPHNWSNIAFIHQILPQAKFIDIRRAPVDCCFSNFTQSFSRAHAASFRLQDIGRCYVDYVRFMHHVDGVAPGLVHHVEYEGLVEQPERELRKTLAYLGLEWDETCLRFYESDRTVRTPSAEQVRRPLNREGMGVWEPYRPWLGPLLQALEPVMGTGAAGPRQD